MAVKFQPYKNRCKFSEFCSYSFGRKVGFYNPTFPKRLFWKIFLQIDNILIWLMRSNINIW